MSHRANKLLKSAFPDGSSNDYTPVVIRKRTATSRKPASGYVRSHEAKVEEKASTGNTSLKKFTPAFVRRVIAARASLKLKQKELNAKLAFPTCSSVSSVQHWLPKIPSANSAVQYEPGVDEQTVPRAR